MKHIFLFFICLTAIGQQSVTEKLDSIFLIAQYYDDSKKDSLRIAAQNLRDITEKTGVPQGELYALRFEGWADEYDGNFDLALDKYLQLLEKAKKAEDEFSINMAYNDIAAIYIHFDQLDKAKAIYLEAINSPGFRDKEDKRLSVFYNNLGIVYKRLGNLDSALYSYGRSLQIKEKLGDERGMADLKINMSSLMVSLKRYDEAEKITLENLAFLKGKDLKADQWANLNNLGGIKFYQKKYAEALSIYRECLKLATEMDSKEREMETSEDMAEIYEGMGQPAQALKFFKRASELRQEILNLETSQRISELQEEFNAKERETENALLSTQLETERQRRTMLIAGLILAAMAVAGITFALQKNQKKNRQLARQNRLIEKQRDKLTELNSEKNNLISIVSHDLRSPFNSIALWNKMLQDSLGSSPLKVAESTEMIAKMAHYGQEMINNILDIERMEINTHTMDLQAIRLHDLVNELVHDFAPAASGKDIKLITNNQLPEDFTLQSDPTLLRRALENLISNALKFSNPHAKVWITMVQKGKKLMLEVKDLGPGISREEQRNLFQKYGKTSATPTSGEVSTGLGLSIVKRIMDELGGKVSIESEEGKGSTFILIFPL